MSWTTYDAQSVPVGKTAMAIIKKDGGYPYVEDGAKIDHKESAKLNGLWALKDLYQAFTLPVTRKLWKGVKGDDTGVFGIGLVAVFASVFTLTYDVVRAPFHVLAGVKNAADAAMHGVLAGLT